ncbi:MAG: hypothetical protein JHC61_04805, partial [Burkholderiaceae bacterium]|nr:hypothetical protein [Burkholderiaceae bacterium]
SDLAREIESGLNLERGWMDNSLNASNVVEQNVESVKPMWPFSASYSDYLSLSNIAQKRLNDKVVDFIDGALAAYSHELKKENSKTGTCD